MRRRFADNLRRAFSILPEKAVRMSGVSISRLSAVNDEYAASRSRELHGGRQSGEAPADDNDVKLRTHSTGRTRCCTRFRTRMASSKT